VTSVIENSGVPEDAQAAIDETIAKLAAAKQETEAPAAEEAAPEESPASEAEKAAAVTSPAGAGRS